MFDLLGYFLADSDLVLCRYCYGTSYAYGRDTLNESGNPYYKGGRHLAFELRSAKTGAVEGAYHFPQMITRYSVDPQHGVILVQDLDCTLHLYAALTGEELVQIRADSELYDYWFEESALCLRLMLPGAEDQRLMGKGYRISYDCSVHEETARTMIKPDSWQRLYDGSPYAVSGKSMIRVDTGEVVLSSGNGDIVLYRSVSPAELRALALTILDGRTLSDGEKEKYYLN